MRPLEKKTEGASVDEGIEDSELVSERVSE
jgi:hypothetical protein